MERTAAATATFVFSRSFAQTWGITIASTVLQNQLKKKLPEAFVQQFPSGSEIAYAAIPFISNLQEPLRSEVRAAFADSLSVVWKVMAGVGGLGLLSVAIMKEVPMLAVIDSRFGLEDDQEDEDEESGGRVHLDGEVIVLAARGTDDMTASDEKVVGPLVEGGMATDTKISPDGEGGIFAIVRSDTDAAEIERAQRRASARRSARQSARQSLIVPRWGIIGN